MADENPPAKPGWKTTEFWVSVTTAIVGFAGALGYITPEQHDVLVDAAIKMGGIVIMVAAAFGYALSRGLAKKQ